MGERSWTFHCSKSWLNCWALLLLAIGAPLAFAQEPASSPSPTASSTVPDSEVPSESWDFGVSDLSICGRAGEQVPPGSEVDVEEFMKRLHGTWRLGSRSIRGLPIDARALFYLDLALEDSSTARGTALMIDYGNLRVLDPLGRTAACPADATVAALWSVSIRKEDDETIHLKMDGEYFGSYGDFRRGVYDTEESRYRKFGASYLSGRLATPSGLPGVSGDLWDRVEFADGNLTYISCKGRYLERYIKLSDEKPTLDGLELSKAWEDRKKNRTLTTPIPVGRVWGGEESSR